MQRSIFSVAAIIVLVAHTGLLAVDSKKAQYIGGTVGTIKENSDGRLSTSNEEFVTFTADRKGVLLHIPYTAISELEYGQKAGRRVGMAILISPLALFSKKRKHYLTISYKDAAGKDQAAVFELGKDIVRITLKIVETRSGKDIQYQDDEARKSGVGGAK